MNLSALEKNVIEVMEEQQAKLGFDGSAVYLFYPLSSLSLLLGVCSGEKTILEALNAFCTNVRDRLGKVEYTLHEDRVSLCIPPKGGEYVKQGLDENKFIVRLIRLVSSHHASMDDVLALFRQYSDHVHVEKMAEGAEFDCLVYFESGEPDGFYYCLKEDMGHVTYHRFTQDDYQAFGF